MNLGLMKLSSPAVRLLKPARTISEKPTSKRWGYDRGTPIDRYYIQKFFEAHKDDISGRVLEIKNNRYTEKHGQNVTKQDVLDIDEDNKQATIIADLAKADHVPSNTFDCFILMETLQLIYDYKAAIEHAYRILKPGGVLLASVPTTNACDVYFLGHEYWRFTAPACQRIFGDIFGEAGTHIEPFGNFASCTAALDGLAAEEVTETVLDQHDPIYTLGVCIRAVKPKK